MIYGADFSGSRTPGGALWYAGGKVEGNRLLLETLVRCDDRLELFAAVRTKGGLWGLDFPFSLAEGGGLQSWDALLETAEKRDREAFYRFLEKHGQNETPCGSGPGCRATDRAVRGYSPLKRVNPGLRAMLFSGLRLLAALRREGTPVFPFDPVAGEGVCEVYPSWLWRELLGKRSPDRLEALAEKAGLELAWSGPARKAWEQAGKHRGDAADAVAAALTATLARPWTIATEEERAAAPLEGAVVRPVW